MPPSQKSSIAELLDDVSAFIRRYMVVRPSQADICALWVVHTHAFDAADFTPYLHIFSPVLRSGKSRLLTILGLLVAKPWYTGHVTGAALVRKTHKEKPTLLLDESDAAFQRGSEYSENLRGILNTGFERDGKISLCVGKDWDPKDFLTFSPKAIGGIGRLPETIEDRAIPIELQRKLRTEVVSRFRKRKVRLEADKLRKSLEHHARLHIAALRAAEPEMPERLNDRQQDVCEPLLAIADLAGGDWPQRARTALLDVLGSETARDDGAGVALLRDIRTCFATRGTDRLSTAELLECLYAMESSPWSEFNRGLPIKPPGLARLLKPFGTGPQNIRFNSGTRKGYLREDFADAWERYLPETAPLSPPEGQQTRQSSIHAGSAHFPEGQQDPLVADPKNGKSPVNMRVVAPVAPLDPKSAENGKRWCTIHPLNDSEWWMRGGDPICELCHPEPR
jgi:hypothetical protein